MAPSHPALLPMAGMLGAFRGRRRMVGLALLLLTFLMGIGMAGGQLGPTSELWQISTRATVDAQFGRAGFNLDEYSGLVFPDFGGGRPLYLGLVTLTLALLALIRPRRGQVLFWGIVAVLTFVLSFGGLTPLYALARLCLPGYGVFKGQERIAYLTVFALSVLAGYGTVWLLQLRTSGLRRRLAVSLSPLVVCLVVFGLATPGVRASVVDGLALGGAGFPSGVPRVPLIVLGSVLVLFVLAGREENRLRRGVRSRTVIGGLALLLPLLAAADVVGVNWTNLVAPPPGLPAVAQPVVDFLGQTHDGRIDANARMPFGGYYYRLPFLRSEMPLMSHYFLNAIEKLGFYASAQLFSQRYQVTTGDLPGNELLFQWNDLRVYRLAGVPGRAHVVYRLASAPNEEDALRRIKDGLDQRTFSITRDAVVDDGLRSDFVGGGFSRAADVVDLEPTELLVTVDSSAPAFLVLADSYYPGWQAYVDGRRVPVHRADYAVRGIELPSGVHLVSFRYEPGWLKIGLAASAACVALLVALLALSLIPLWLRHARPPRGPNVRCRHPRASLRHALGQGLSQENATSPRAVCVLACLLAAPWLAVPAVLLIGAFVLAPPVIPASLHDAARWDAAYAWAGQQCKAIVSPAHDQPGTAENAPLSVYGNWSAARGESAQVVDRVCLVDDVVDGPPGSDLIAPTGWQVDQAAWFGTIWAASYVRQESLLSQIQNRRDTSLGATLELLGFSWAGAGLQSDVLHVRSDALPADVDVFLRAVKTTPIDYRVFVQLLDEQGHLVSLSDHQPRDGARPTSTWTAGEILGDRHQLPRPPTLEPGSYLLIAGAYDEKTGEHLRTPAGEDHVVLAQVQVD